MEPYNGAAQTRISRRESATHRIAMALVFSSLACTGACIHEPPSVDDAPGELSREEAIEELLDGMTLEEKVGQMALMNVSRLMGSWEWDRGPLNEDWLEIAFDEAHVGSVLSGGGANPIPNTPEGWTELVNELQDYAISHSRRGIPLLYGVDAVHGFNLMPSATIFPHNIGMAASRDPALQARLSARTAAIARAMGVNWTFSPVADLGKDPRWGRFYETFGEDHVLSAQFTSAAVEGYQHGDLSAPDAIAATAKHFAGYGHAQSGLDRTDAELSLRTLRDQHIEPFRHAVAAGVASIMPNSGSVNGVPAHASHYLLTEVLRDELGFEGVVVSDWNDLHYLVDRYHVAGDLHDAVAMGINAGVDLYMLPHNPLEFTNAVLDGVEDGSIAAARIDEAAGRVLGMKWDLGLFDWTPKDPEEARAVAQTADRELAREAARESLVLLRNEEGVLPLATEGDQQILVTGFAADNLRSQMGGWTIGWQGADDPNELPDAVTMLDGIVEVAGEERVIFEEGAPAMMASSDDASALQAGIDSAVAAAEMADVIVAVVGEPPYAEAAGDSPTLTLAEEQQQLIAALGETGKPLVVVVVAGRPLIMDAVVDAADAILMAHLPGTEGGHAVADVLFGTYNPNGRLPYSWPRHVGQLPLEYNAPYAASEVGTEADAPSHVYDPLFPFGFGVSYGALSEGVPALASRRVSKTENVRTWIDLGNWGPQESDIAVELYARAETRAVIPARRQLVAFARTTVPAYSAKTVELSFPVSRLAITVGDVDEHSTRDVPAGNYVLETGGGQRAEFVVEAD